MLLSNNTSEIDDVGIFLGPFFIASATGKVVGAFGSRQVVHHDYFAVVEFRHEDASDVGEERFGLHQSVEHPRGSPVGAAQAGDEGRGLAMSEGDAGAQALAPPTTNLARSMLVDAQVLSMRTSLSGSRSCDPSNHSSRRFKTSERPCFVAWPAFSA